MQLSLGQALHACLSCVQHSDAGNLSAKSFLGEANMFFKRCPEFWDNSLHIGLRLRGKRFRAKLLNLGLGLDRHLRSLSNKIYPVDTGKPLSTKIICTLSAH